MTVIILIFFALMTVLNFYLYIKHTPAPRPIMDPALAQGVASAIAVVVCIIYLIKSLL